MRIPRIYQVGDYKVGDTLELSAEAFQHVVKVLRLKQQAPIILFNGHGSHFNGTVVEVTKKMTNFELSDTGSYMDNYIAALFLPHTDINQFPKLKARLEARKKN